MSPKNKNPRKT